MLSYIYIPFNAFQRPFWSRSTEDKLDKPHHIVGYHVKNSFVVVDIIDKIENADLQSLDPDLQIIGSMNSDGTSTTDPTLIHLRYNRASKLPFADPRDHSEDQSYTIVFFEPPNLRNLEYFTVRPILLQSTDMTHEFKAYTSNISKSHCAFTDSGRLSICNEKVLDKINGCSVMRSRIRALGGDKRAKSGVRWLLLAFFKRIFEHVHTISGRILVKLVGSLIWMTVWLITVLNTDVYGINPVESSSWCRQLDLRLRQLSYFPFQFLGYQDTDFLKASVREALGLPLSNERRNVNNSNYINLYNTVWLIINDILIGRTLYHVLSKDLDKKLRIINNVMLEICFTKLDKFISWIGSDYPGGLKLNNDLGQFMELLFLWTSQTSRLAFELLALPSGSGMFFIYLVKLWFQVSCLMGLTFTIACIADYIKIVNIHTHIFCLASTKIYFRQVEMLKSLWQLFRGRKYNVLRNRIDKIEEDQLRIDQLLLGTFVFLVLIYLLPTTFAFYLLFYVFRVTMSTFLKMGDKVILVLNLYPLFVLLLKLKNSRRLQGGVHFTPKGRHETTEWVLMENKALTLDEICGNFYHVFRQEGRFDRLFLNFVEGRDLEVRDTWQLKHQYLMLPKKVTALSEIWREATNDGSGNISL